MYLLHNTIRDRNTRLARLEHGSKRGMVQFVLKSRRRLVRARPLHLTEEEMLENLKELQELQRSGKAKVTLRSGVPVDLFTLREVPVAPVANTTPNFPLDSINRDKPSGIRMDRNDQPPPVDFVMPVEPPDAAVDDPIPDLSDEMADVDEVEDDSVEEDGDISDLLAGGSVDLDTEPKAVDPQRVASKNKKRRNRR